MRGLVTCSDGSLSVGEGAGAHKEKEKEREYANYRKGDGSSSLGFQGIDRACKLLRKVSKKLGTKIGGFIVAEEHRNGTFHVHGLMRLGALSNDTSKDMLREFWAMGLELYGRNSFALVKDSEAVRKYVAKYLIKGPADHRFINIWSDKMAAA